VPKRVMGKAFYISPGRLCVMCEEKPITSLSELQRTKLQVLDKTLYPYHPNPLNVFSGLIKGATQEDSGHTPYVAYITYNRILTGVGEHQVHITHMGLAAEYNVAQDYALLVEALDQLCEKYSDMVIRIDTVAIHAVLRSPWARCKFTCINQTFYRHPPKTKTKKGAVFMPMFA
jgi:hypothetical protein